MFLISGVIAYETLLTATTATKLLPEEELKEKTIVESSPVFESKTMDYYQVYTIPRMETKETKEKQYLNVTDKIDIISFTFTDGKTPKPVYKVSNKGIQETKPIDEKPLDELVK